ncbi:RING finger protein 150-like [Haliotis rufescens]|uniref:RING finger protein 150-like n=1 Tax=Haliotis rufescens TaxID=6454 RepID=UPI00201EA094|nr:RING finger protein 150-like [Haliotis rufescens]
MVQESPAMVRYCNRTEPVFKLVPETIKNQIWPPNTRLFSKMTMVMLLLSPLLAMPTVAETQYKVYFNISYRRETTNDTLSYESSKGRFAAGVKLTRLEPVIGRVVHVKTVTGKTHGCDDYSMTVPPVSWIALITHGECPMLEKMAKAVKYNASAVVVYGNGSTGKVTYAVKHDAEGVAAISVPDSDGAYIADLVDRGITVMMYIAVNQTQTNDDSNHYTVSYNNYHINKTHVSISFAVIIVLAIIGAVCVFKKKVHHPPQVYFERTADWEAIPQRERQRIMN